MSKGCQVNTLSRHYVIPNGYLRYCGNILHAVRNPRYDPIQMSFVLEIPHCERGITTFRYRAVRNDVSIDQFCFANNVCSDTAHPERGRIGPQEVKLDAFVIFDATNTLKTSTAGKLRHLQKIGTARACQYALAVGDFPPSFNLGAVGRACAQLLPLPQQARRHYKATCRARLLGTSGGRTGLGTGP